MGPLAKAVERWSTVTTAVTELPTVPLKKGRKLNNYLYFQGIAHRDPH